MDYLKRYDIFGWQCPLHNGQSVLLGEKYTEHSRSQTESWLKAAWDRYSKDLSGSLEKMERKWGISIPSEIFILTDHWVSLLVYIFQSNTFRQSSKSVVKKRQKGKVIHIKSTDNPFKKPHQTQNLTTVADPQDIWLKSEQSYTLSAEQLPDMSFSLHVWANHTSFFHSAPGDLLVEYQNGFAKLC